MSSLEEVRTAAADAVRAKIPAGTDVRVYEVDVITARDLPNLIKEAEGLRSVQDSELGEAGPGVVCVMAAGRDEDQSVNISAFTLIKNRLLLKQGQAGIGRGLKVVDIVESGLGTLRTAGLPDRLVKSEVAVLPRDLDVTEVRIFLTECKLPPGSLTTPISTITPPGSLVPDPLDPSIPGGGAGHGGVHGGAPGAIRARIGQAITEALKLTTQAQAIADPTLVPKFLEDLNRLGNTEARYRAAVINGLVPRCRVTLKGLFRTEGGTRDVGTGKEYWEDTSGIRWGAQCFQQPVVATVEAWDYTLNHADLDAIAIAGKISGGFVIHPGHFEAWVQDPMDLTSMILDQRTDGTSEREMRIEGGDRAAWDYDQGLARASIQVDIATIDPMEPATQSATGTAVEPTASFLGREITVRVGEDHVFEPDEYLAHFNIPAGAVLAATIKDTSIATVATSGTQLTITGVAVGETTLVLMTRIGRNPARNRRTIKVVVIA